LEVGLGASWSLKSGTRVRLEFIRDFIVRHIHHISEPPIMTDAKLKVSPSHLEATLADKPHLKRYASQIKAIDKDQNGEVDLVELCEVLEELETSNRNRKLLRWVAIVTALFSLLSIAAIVGLTYAVVDLSKDTSVSNNVLVTKDDGNTLATATAKEVKDLGYLVNATPQELADLEVVVLPMDNNRTQILHVSDLELDLGVSLTVNSPSGKSIIIAADGSVMDVNATSAEGGSRRRLLGLFRGFGVGPMSNININKLQEETISGSECDFNIPMNGYKELKYARGRRFLPFFESPFSPYDDCTFGLEWKWSTKVVLKISDGGKGKDRIYGLYYLKVFDHTGREVAAVLPTECEARKIRGGVSPADCSTIITERWTDVTLNFPTLSFTPKKEKSYSFGMEVEVQTDSWVQWQWEGVMDSRNPATNNGCYIIPQDVQAGKFQGKLPAGKNFLPLVAKTFALDSACSNSNIKWVWKTDTDITIDVKDGKGSDQVKAPTLKVTKGNGSRVTSIEGNECMSYVPGSWSGANNKAVNCVGAVASRDRNLSIKFPPLQMSPKLGEVYKIGIEFEVETDDDLVIEWPRFTLVPSKSS
jgi:hypothetical protein